MKKTILTCALGAFVIMQFNSCTKIANAVAQAISWQGIDVTVSVPPVSDLAPHAGLGTSTFTYNLDSFVKSQTANLLSMSNIDTFRFTSCTLTIQNPDSNDNFQNFQMAEGSFYTSTNTTSTSLGEIDNNPNTYAATLSLPINTTTNLKSYLPNSGPVTINYTYGGQMRKATADTLHVNVHIGYYIHVTP